MRQLLLSMIFTTYCLMAAPTSAISQTATITINDYMLTDKDLQQIQTLYGVTPLSGTYWYDQYSGAYGVKGGPALGVMYPGHIFGTLSPDASNGNSGVFVNNRQLQKQEALAVARLFGYVTYVPGYYWLAANGDIGMIGNPSPLGNIYRAIARSHTYHPSAGDHFWSRGLYSGGNYYTGANGQPSQGYVSVPGYGPVSHGMN